MKTKAKAYVGLTLIIVVTLFLGVGATKLYTKNSQESELPDSDEIVRTNELLEEVFGEKDVIMVGLKVEEGDIYTPATIQKAIDIVEDLKKIDGVVSDEILSLPAFNHISSQDWNLEVGEFITGSQVTDQKYLSYVKNEVAGDPLLEGILVSEDGTLLNIVANIEEGYSEEQVYAQLLAIKEKYQHPEVILLAGDPVQQKEIDLGIKEDLGVLLPVALALILLGFWVCFRRLYGVIMPFAVVIMSIVWTMGCMGWLGLPITIVSSVIPILMIAVSSSYGIHVLSKYYEERVMHDATTAAERTVKKIGPAILMTGFTSSISALTLVVFKVSSIRDFGIISAIGIVNVVVISLVLLPSLLVLVPPGKGLRGKDYLGETLTKLALISMRYKRTVLASFALLLALSAVGVSKLEVGNNFIEFFPEDHTLRATFGTYSKKLGGARYIDIMFDGGSPDALKNPHYLQQMAAFEHYASSLEGVGSVTSFSEIIKKINQEIHDGDPAYRKIPDTTEEIAQYLFLYSVSGSPSNFDELIDQDYQRAKIRMMLTTSEQRTHTHIYESLKQYSTTSLPSEVSVAYGGEVMFWLAQIKYIVKGKVENILLSIAIIAVFCIVAFKSVKYGLISAIPMVGSSIMTFGLMGFLGIRLEIGTAVITAIGIGIGIDFAIHYLMRYRYEISNLASEAAATEATMKSSGRAVLYDVFSNLIGFSVFIFSGFVPIQNFGWLICFTMITVSLGTLVLFPALLSLRPIRKSLPSQRRQVKLSSIK